MSTRQERTELPQEPRVDTVCRAICALVDRAYRDDSHERYDDAITRLSSMAMNATDVLNPFIIALDERLEKRDYAAALLIARAMVAHEDSLLRSAEWPSGRPANQLH